MARDKRSLADRRPFHPIPAPSICDSWPTHQRLAVHQTTTHRWDFETDLHEYRDAGIQTVGAWRYKVEDYGVDDARELLKQTGLRVSSLSWAGGFAFNDPEAHQAAIVDGLEAVQTAASLGAANLIVIPGNRGGYTPNHARKLIIDAIQQLGDAAALHGIQIAIQPVDPKFAGDGFFLDTLDKYLDLLRDCRHPNVGLNLDLFHLGRTPCLIQRVSEIIPWVRLVQLSDSCEPRSDLDRCQLGEGTLPVDQLIEALEVADYRGFYEVCLMSPAIWNGDYRQILSQAQRHFRSVVAH